jgi:hypothetical protein
MGWTERERGPSAVEEWERDDGWATVRLRSRADDSWVVRLDRLTQAPEGSLYREERVRSRAAAEDLAADWRETYDVSDGDRA